MTEGSSEGATGVPNTIYDLSSVLFHALEGGASYDTYIRDAQEAGDQELANFFRRVSGEDSMRADEARRLLAERTPTSKRAVEETAVSSEGVFGNTPPMVESDEVRPEVETAPISEPGKQEPDVPPLRPEEPPPPGTGVGG
jgi:hypothetical protein